MTVSCPEDRCIEVVVAPRTSVAPLLRDLAALTLPAGVVAGIAVAFTIAISRLVFPIPTGIRVLIVLSAFAALFVPLGLTLIREHYRRTTFRVTPDRLIVSISGVLERPRQLEWRRDAVFEVRPGGRRGSQLHVRLARGLPCKLLGGRESHEIEEVAAVIKAAMSSIPPARFDEFVVPDVIAYELPGQPYEIEIQPLSDGVRVVVPRAGDRAVSELAVWVIPVHVLFGAGACARHFYSRGARSARTS